MASIPRSSIHADRILDKIRFGKSRLTDINDPECSQPFSTGLQVALVHLLRSFGLKPAAVLGHSSGEIAAA